MKQIKMKLIILMGVFIMTMLGCGQRLSHEERAIKLLNEKYNDFFEVEEVQSRSSFGKYYTVIAYQENNPDVLFRAEIDFDDSNVSDNYVSKILCQKISDRVAQNLNGLGGVYYIFSEPMIELTMLDDVNITPEEYMEKSPANKFVIYLNYLPEGDTPEEIYAELQQALKGLESVSGQIQLYIMDEDKLRWVQDYLENNDALYDEYQSMVEQHMVGIIKIEKGQICNSKEEVMQMLENRL